MSILGNYLPCIPCFSFWWYVGHLEVGAGFRFLNDRTQWICGNTDTDITWWLLTKRPGPTSLLLANTLSRLWSSIPCQLLFVPGTLLYWPSPCCFSPPSWRTSLSPPTGSTPPTSTSMSSGPQSTCSTGSRGTRKHFILVATFGPGLEEILWKWL